MSFIKKIRIKNFKSLEDVEIEMNQLTFLFGPNSSGKSSFIKAMMFLAKNIFPLNTGQTLYKVNDNVDLGTYKDIVTDNDVNKNIVFEFDLEGKFEFPLIDVIIDSDQDFMDIEMDFDLNFELLKKNNFFKEFDYLIKHIGPYGEELKRILKKFEFNNTFRIVFTNDLKGENLLTLSISDNILKSRYDYIYRLDKKDVYKDRTEFNPECPYFTFLDNKLISELLNNHYIDNFIEFPISLYDNFSSTYDNTVSEYENFAGKLEINPISFGYWLKEWININHTEKKSVYYEVLKFLYLSQRLVPTILKSFFQSKHLPTTRQIPKKIYLLERNNFNANEYYGILSRLNFETETLKKMFENLISKPLKEISFDVIIKLFDEVNSINIAKSNNENIKNSTVKSNKLKTSGRNYNEILKLYMSTNHFKINNQLCKFGFDHFYFIDINDDIGRIYLFGKNNTKTYMADTSSGFIQVFPIIVCCYLLQKNYIYKLNRLKELKKNDINERYFEENTNLIGYLADESLTLPYSNNFSIDYYTLLIEQPELHLHPKLQSKLAELFNETLSNMDELNSLIVETHSEHLIRKIQVLIARGELDRSKLSVQYFNNENGITKTETMEIDEHGLFVKDWPNGFFDDSVNLTMELYEAIREIKKRKN